MYLHLKMPIKKQKTHTIIISDLHLGSSISQPEKVIKVLKSYSFRKLILLGDVFDSLDFRNLDEKSWELLTYIGKALKNKKIRWVVGNHDFELVKIFKTLMNAKIYETYTWHYKKNRYLATHGHQFDRFLINNQLLSSFTSNIYYLVYKLDTEDKKVSKFIKKKSKGWLRLTKRVARKAIKLAKKEDANFVFCGHTHKAISKSGKGVRYFNSGCFTDSPCTYITINDGSIEIRKI